MTAPASPADWTALPVPPSLLGESPFWHPDEAALYWCDIPGKQINRWVPATAAHTHWAFDSEPGCCAPLGSRRSWMVPTHSRPCESALPSLKRSCAGS